MTFHYWKPLVLVILLLVFAAAVIPALVSSREAARRDSVTGRVRNAEVLIAQLGEMSRIAGDGKGTYELERMQGVISLLGEELERAQELLELQNKPDGPADTRSSSDDENVFEYLFSPNAVLPAFLGCMAVISTMWLSWRKDVREAQKHAIEIATKKTEDMNQPTHTAS